KVTRRMHVQLAQAHLRETQLGVLPPIKKSLRQNSRKRSRRRNRRVFVERCDRDEIPEMPARALRLVTSLEPLVHRDLIQFSHFLRRFAYRPKHVPQIPSILPGQGG